MTIEVKTIPEMLVKTRGNLSELARQLDINRSTVLKYARDFKSESHAVINGRLMVKTSKKTRKNDG